MKHREDVQILVFVSCLILVIALGALGWWIFRSSMEASAYNRVTGSNVTTWEAMWIELRVQEAPQSKP